MLPIVFFCNSPLSLLILGPNAIARSTLVYHRVARNNFGAMFQYVPGDQCELEQRHQRHHRKGHAPGNRLLAAAPAAVRRLQRCDVAAGCHQLQCHRQCHHSAVGTMAGGSGAEPDANAKFGREPGEHQWFDGGSQMLGGGLRHVLDMFFLGEAFQPFQLARAQHRMLIHSPPKKWEDDISYIPQVS